MYKDYDAEQVMLSDDLKKKREDELFNADKELKDLQRKRFGYEGDIFKKRRNYKTNTGQSLQCSSKTCCSKII